MSIPKHEPIYQEGGIYVGRKGFEDRKYALGTYDDPLVITHQNIAKLLRVIGSVTEGVGFGLIGPEHLSNTVRHAVEKYTLPFNMEQAKHIDFWEVPGYRLNVEPGNPDIYYLPFYSQENMEQLGVAWVTFEAK